MGCHVYGECMAVSEEEEGIRDKIGDTLTIDETKQAHLPNSRGNSDMKMIESREVPL